jgi:hypothetical protein
LVAAPREGGSPNAAQTGRQDGERRCAPFIEGHGNLHLTTAEKIAIATTASGLSCVTLTDDDRPFADFEAILSRRWAVP